MSEFVYHTSFDSSLAVNQVILICPHPERDDISIVKKMNRINKLNYKLPSHRVYQGRRCNARYGFRIKSLK